MTDHFSILLSKLDTFIRKYYSNQLIKGLLIVLAGSGVMFIGFTLFEYFGYFNTGIRAVLFYGFILFNLIILTKFVFIPIAALLKIGKRVSLEEAAKILGKHFKNEVDDKILNTLQLKRFFDNHPGKNELIIASIEQKSKKLSPIPFSSAVNFRENVRYVPVTLIVLIILGSGWFLFPVMFKEPASRIMLYSQEFERPAPFKVIMVSNPYAVKNQRYILRLEVEGSVVPNQLELIVGNNSYAMNRNSGNEFEYEFRSFNEPVSFRIRAGNFNFGPFKIGMVSKAVIKNFSIYTKYPTYTGMPDEVFNNVGDIRIPVGTNLIWNVFTEDTESVGFNSNSERSVFKRDKKNVFNKEIAATDNFDYSIVAFNDSNVRGDSLKYFVNVIPDIYPTITIEEFQDSVMLSHLYFRGLITDDYGFSGLRFRYRVLSSNDQNRDNDIPFENNDIPHDSGNVSQSFYYHINLNEYDIKPGTTYEYFFEVADNDGINGPKVSRTRVYSFGIPDYQEMLAETLASDEEVKSGLNQSINEISNIQDEIDQLRRSMLESDKMSWEQQETLKNLLEKQRQAQENYEKLKEFTEQKQTREQQFRKEDDNILKKQEELQKLFDEVLTDEMKELYEKIQEELEKLNRENVFDMLRQMEFEMQDLENRLDRALELFKQLQVERMLNESIESLERIQDKLEELKDEVTSDGIDENTINQQEDINQDFDNLSGLINDMMDKNEDLSRPNQFDDTSGLQEDIWNDLKNALNEMQKGDSGSSGEQQDNASGKMDQLNQSLKAMQARMQQENLAEDIRTLREILDNLIKSSFAQEDLMEEIRTVNVRDPRYVNLIQQQRKISSDLEMIKDSLNALAKRQIQIQGYVTREIASINMNIEDAIDQLVNRRKHTGLSRQQFVMTHINNLALLLNESMENMQNQMQMQMSGDGGDPKTGMPAPGFQDLRQMQEQMNQMLEELRQGQQPMPGESGDTPMSMSEQLARMAAEQEAIRNRLNELTRNLRGDGENTSELEQLMREMERTELDIVTNNITRMTQLRQQRILTRLLEHERAEMEREQEERRVGETAKFYDLSNPEDFFEYNRRKNRSLDMLQSLPPGFRPHYKNLVELYFLNVQE